MARKPVPKRKGYADGGPVNKDRFEAGEPPMPRDRDVGDPGPTRGRAFTGDADVRGIPNTPTSSGRKFGMENKFGPGASPGFAKGGKVKKPMFEGSKKDLAQDKAGARKMGVSQKAYENTARDKAQDKAGQRQMYGKRK